MISSIINGTEELIDEYKKYGVNIISTGGETADVGDIVRTIIVDSTVISRMRRSDVIDNKNIKVNMGEPILSPEDIPTKLLMNNLTVPNGKIKINDQIFHSEYRRERTYVPFNIELIDFEKIMHPGTNVAKSFSSDVNLIENDIPRRTLIKMNEPLRHKGYTFFQASFIDDSDVETTVLATVKNYGRLFPYISSIINDIKSY